MTNSLADTALSLEPAPRTGCGPDCAAARAATGGIVVRHTAADGPFETVRTGIGPRGCPESGRLRASRAATRSTESGRGRARQPPLRRLDRGPASQPGGA